MNAVKLLGSLLGNNATGGNMLGGLLKGVMGGGQQQSSGGGALGMISGLLGGGGGQSSGGGGPLGMLSGILGGGQSSGGGGGGGPLGMLSGLLGGGKEAPAPEPQAQDQATLLIRAMCNAAKADGQIDEAEQNNIIGKLGGDLDQAEEAFLRKELNSPLDVDSFARSIPSDMGANVYAFSVMTVKVDTREEVAYLQQLAQGLNLDNATLSSIHKELGVG